MGAAALRSPMVSRRDTRALNQEFAHGQETSTASSRQNPAGRISRSAQTTPYAVAAALHVPRTRIERIAREEKPVTADTALRLGKFLKTGAAFRMNIQARFDLETAEDVLARRSRRLTAELKPPTDTMILIS